MRDLYENLLSFFWIAVHHRWTLLISAFLICLLGWAIVYLLPNKYVVNASIYFDNETALTPVLKGIADKDFSGDERALIVRRTLTNESSLREIAEASGHKLSEYSEEDVGDILTKLFKNIVIENKSLNDSTDEYVEKNLYTIQYTDTDPDYVLAVVTSIIDLFIEKFIRTGDKGSEKVEGFLEENIAEYKSKLEEAEDKLKQFKQKHPNLSQQTGNDFFSRLNQIKTDIEESKLKLIEEQNRNFTLRSQLNRVIFDSKSSAGAEIKAKELSLIDQRIQDVKRKLAELKLQYTDKHPDVQSSERILKQLLAQKVQEDKNPVSVSNSNASSLVKSDLYQQLQLNVSNSNSKISALKARISQYQTKLEEMNTQITVMPEIESELVRLTRDYTVTKQTYDSLVQKRSSSELTRQAERSGQELQYQILDEPKLPTFPSFPDRELLSSVVFFVGLIGGFLVAWLMEQFNPKVYREKQIEEEFGLEIYGNVPMYWSPTEMAARRAGAIFYSVIFVGLLAAYISVLVHYGFSIEPYIDDLKEFIGQKSL